MASQAFAGSVESLIFELGVQAWTPVSLLMSDPDLPNRVRKLSLVAGAPTGRVLAPGRQAPCGDSETLAHDDHGNVLLVVVEHRRVHGLSREKMLPPGWRKSRSG